MVTTLPYHPTNENLGLLELHNLWFHVPVEPPSRTAPEMKSFVRQCGVLSNLVMESINYVLFPPSMLTRNRSVGTGTSRYSGRNGSRSRTFRRSRSSSIAHTHTITHNTKPTVVSSQRASPVPNKVTCSVECNTADTRVYEASAS